MSNEIVAKQLTYIEVDLDVYRATQFETVVDGQAISSWTSRWGSGTTFLGEVPAATMPSGRAARLTHSSGNRSLWSYDAVPDLRNSSILTKLHITTAVSDLVGVACRASGGNGTDNAYLATLSGGTTFGLYKTSNGSSSTLATISFSYGNGAELWIRCDTINVSGGVLIRAKMWVGDPEDEPSVFMVAFTDTSSPYTLPNKVGLYTDLVTDVLCGYFRARSFLSDTLETLRFSSPTDYLPLKEIPSIPNLESVSINPSRISLGTNLGKRATLSVSLNDHLHADRGEFYNNGSHWGKFRARQIFRRGQAIRLIRGLVGQDINDMEKRHYTLESFNGPTRDGKFTIISHDVLKLSDNDRSQAPALSDGFLLAAITDAATSATLAPAGIGNSQYPASGYVAIGGTEICAFTRSGDTLTLTRGQFNTVPIAHDAEDRVQLCLFYTAVTPSGILNHLFTTFASIPSSLIPLSDWDSEVNTHLQRLYTRLIAEPTGVNKLASELIEQAGLAVWFDEVENKIRLRVLRGIPASSFLYDERNVLQNSLQIQEQPSTRITQIWTYYGVLNPLDSLEEANNYRSTLTTIDTEAETLNGDAAIRKVYGTWIPAFGRDTAQRVNDLQLGRFSQPPRRISFDLQRYSGIPELRPGDGCRISWDGNQDELGSVISAPIQVVNVNPLADRLQIEAEEMLFKQFDPADLTDRVITIDSPIFNVDLPTLHNLIFPVVTPADVIAGVNLTVIIASNVTVGSGHPNFYSFRVGESGQWPTSFPITILIQSNARIQGAGGAGGSNGFAGNFGGAAIRTRFPVTINNLGAIWGGGGGGGSAVSSLAETGGGGGGAGQVPGAGGSGNYNGQSGTINSGGVGGDPPAGTGGEGGTGGSPGNPGNPGNQALNPPAGGQAGFAIDGISFVTFTNTGDVRGPTGF